MPLGDRLRCTPAEVSAIAPCAAQFVFRKAPPGLQALTRSGQTQPKSLKSGRIRASFGRPRAGSSPGRPVSQLGQFWGWFGCHHPNLARKRPNLTERRLSVLRGRFRQGAMEGASQQEHGTEATARSHSQLIAKKRPFRIHLMSSMADRMLFRGATSSRIVARCPLCPRVQRATWSVGQAFLMCSSWSTVRAARTRALFAFHVLRLRSVGRLGVCAWASGRARARLCAWGIGSSAGGGGKASRCSCATTSGLL